MLRYQKVLFLAAVIVAGMLCATAQATTWDFASSISTSNPLGGVVGTFSIWAWGIPTGGSSATFQQAGINPQRWQYSSYSGPAGLYSYTVDDYNDPYRQNRNPGIGSQFAYNILATDFASQSLDNYSGAQFATGPKYYVPSKKFLVTLLNQPNGQAVQTYQANCTARWTAPTEGDYTITATWTGRKVDNTNGIAADGVGGTVPVALLVAGVSQFSGTSNVANNTAATSWTGTMHLLQGQTVDSQLLPNTGASPINGNAYIQMDMVIQSQDVPEPGAFLMLATSLVGLAGFKLRKR